VSYQVELAPAAVKQVKKLPSDIRQRVVTLEELAANLSLEKGGKKKSERLLLSVITS
jgi:mRNA-degrading endonuclease RelE of RelBE toxin-antitoxin system